MIILFTKKVDCKDLAIMVKTCNKQTKKIYMTSPEIVFYT